MPSFRVNFRKRRLKNAEFSLSKKENEAAGGSFSAAILENEGGVERGEFSKERSSTVAAIPPANSVKESQVETS